MLPRRNLIDQSWKRSLKLGVDQHRTVNEILKGGELLDRRDELKEFFKATNDILEQLLLQLKKSNFMVIVSDPDGYIVNTWGEPPFSERAKNVRLDTGANWNERVKGTNAIGTALYEKKPISVVGEEHFCKENHFLTCYAAPLYSPTGELLCILDVSGDAQYHHPHTMGMVVAAAQACQARLLLQQTKNELILALNENDILMDEHHQPLLSVNESGIITRLNQQAAQILGRSISDCIGKPLSNWFREETDEILSSNSQSTKVLSLQSEDSEEQTKWVVHSVLDNRKRVYRGIVKPIPKKNTQVKRSQLVNECPKMKKVISAAKAIAPTKATVLIQGETGSGKEWVAQTVHEASGRNGPFLVVNCGALPEQLIESELFGYEKGAFTGANKEGKKGKFEAADGGTLFLDEIGELPLASQVVLLRVLEEKHVTRIGGHRPRPVDVRIVAATNRNLPSEIQKGTFRADLFYRLCEFELHIPPLRKREDIQQLINFFIEKTANELGVDKLYLDNSGLKKLKTYHWPGNVRELKQVVRQSCYNAYILRESWVITANDIDLPFLRQSGEIYTRLYDDKGSLLEDQEEKTIKEVLKNTKGNIAESARILGISRTTLYRKLNQYETLKVLQRRMKDEGK
ncbi:sigma-54-dependent Fis family transcriptional regulator [Marinithermofilum abyssi]|uniref:Sigma-54-dependent Fis family transcriptional regulator n=1 Tax=Marinithermofilum abyssi TaxID=1571185 RepID=A0A8J2VGZ9_9BACL|nr:sigma-54-dependent Fis family transcriptional regulator [Marinithermofilum abyssi]GGE29929.1 sigma-54-dependent Fis family transcriptional regulator [Marinithermofilum abyssi]